MLNKIIFNIFRQPGREQDKQSSSGVESKEKEFIVVGRKGHWYSLIVKNNNKWCTLEDIYGSLMELWEVSEHEAEQDHNERIGYLTAQDRNTWADAYSELAQSDKNQQNLELFSNCLLVVCLDDETQNYTDNHRSLKDMFRQMMTGGGSRYDIDKYILTHQNL